MRLRIREIKKYLMPVIVAGFFSLTACFALPVEEEVLPPPPIDTFTPAAYNTITVVREDLRRYRDLTVNYEPAREEVLYFDALDIPITAINVKIGDLVKEGDIIAELNRDSIIRELESAEREEIDIRMSLEHLEAQRQLYLQQAAASGSAIDESSFFSQYDTLNKQLANVQKLRSELSAEDERRVVRATMDGTITSVMSFRDGDVSRENQRVAVITDQTESIFVVSGSQAEYLEIGEEHTIYVEYEPYNAVVIDPEEYNVIPRDDTPRKFLVITDEDPPQATRGTLVTMQVTLDIRENVISVPYIAVKQAGDRTFVFVLEDGVRVTRDVETGLEGNFQIEIVSGLSEGDVVIR